MKRKYAVIAGLVAGATLIIAASSFAHPGGMGPGFGPGMGAGMGPGMGPGMMMRGGPMAGQQLMTPEERQAFVEKMRNAKTPEERQKLAEGNRAEMEKRAKEKGLTLPQPHGPMAGSGPNFAPPFAAPTR